MSYKCNNCEKTFSGKQELTSHINNSHKTYKPCINCDKCEREDCRYNHNKLQGNQEICYKCGLEFTSKTNIINHIKTIHGSEICHKFLQNECSRSSKECIFSHKAQLQESPQQNHQFFQESYHPPLHSPQVQNMPSTNINKSTNINNHSTSDITNDAPHNEPNNPVTGQIEPQLSMIRLDPVNTEKKSVIFNYTNIVLSDSMEKVLNRGLNFSILPKKMDMTQLRVDLKRFKRSAIWKEYFYRRDQGKLEEQIFKTNKSNLPKNYQIPEGLKIFLNSVESELYDPRNRNQAKCNISPEEMEALEELIKLQKDKKIVIKECDKGAGVIILTYSEYMRACYNHLTAEQEPGRPYYSPVSALFIEATKTKIENTLKEAIDNKTITTNEYIAMDPKEKGPGRFYCNFKVHKEHEPNKAPPERPITSQSGSICEGIATFVEHHINHIAKEHETYIQDTPDFLRELQKKNNGPKLDNNNIHNGCLGPIY